MSNRKAIYKKDMAIMMSYPLSILLPTYNERENLPIMIELLYQTFQTHPING